MKIIHIYIICFVLFITGILASYSKLEGLARVFSYMGIAGGLLQLLIGGQGLLRMSGFLKRGTECSGYNKLIFPMFFVLGAYLLFTFIARIS